MIKLIKIFIIVFIVIPILFLLLWGLLYSFYVNNPANIKSKDIEFTILQGESVGTISENLYNKGLISSQFWFKVYSWFKKNEAKFQSGKYVLNTNMSIKEITRILVTGQTLDREETIKIIEGWNLMDIADLLNDKDIFSKESWFELVGKMMVNYDFDYKSVKPYDYSDQFSFLKDKPKNFGLEGYLFPDTYRVYKNSTPNMIVVKMLSNFDKKLTQKMRDDIAAQGKTIYEIVTMASIIQKEVAKNDDMAIVSGILYKRIKTGMRLGVDSTVNYASGKSNPSATYDDLKINSLYNTYQHDGLPPGPICNPGLQAIMAAIYPKDSPYFFYLNRQDTGETIFSKNFKEHILNKKKYLK